MTREQMIATAETFVDFDAGRYWERGVEKPMPAHYLPMVRTAYIPTSGHPSDSECNLCGAQT